MDAAGGFCRASVCRWVTRLSYLSLIVLIPLAATFARLWEHQLGKDLSQDRDRTARGFVVQGEPRDHFACRRRLINVVFGLLVAWVLVRYRFPGKRLVDAMVDLPFALPTAVAGIALMTIYNEKGWLGKPLAALWHSVVRTRLWESPSR